MKFAKIVFWTAGVWGVLVLTPLYLIFNLIGKQDPPPITHPGFYYGFVGIGLVWQLAFMMIATDPLRFRPFMVVAVLEKFSFGIAMIVLYFQSRVHSSDLVLVAVDLSFGVLFGIAFAKTNS